MVQYLLAVALHRTVINALVEQPGWVQLQLQRWTCFILSVSQRGVNEGLWKILGHVLEHVLQVLQRELLEGFYLGVSWEGVLLGARLWPPWRSVFGWRLCSRWARRCRPGGYSGEFTLLLPSTSIALKRLIVSLGFMSISRIFQSWFLGGGNYLAELLVGQAAFVFFVDFPELISDLFDHVVRGVHLPGYVLDYEHRKLFLIYCAALVLRVKVLGVLCQFAGKNRGFCCLRSRHRFFEALFLVRLYWSRNCGLRQLRWKAF